MKPRAFVLMPFAPEFNEIYNLFIVPTVTQVGYDVTRADDLLSQRNILRDILESIAMSDLVIADLTKTNPNVYYELGLAHSLRKPVILLTQSVEDLPFDLRSYRVIPYNTHFATIDKARQQLLELARGALNNQIAFGSPVSDFCTIEDFIKVITSGSSNKFPDTQKGKPGYLDYVVAMEEGFAKMTSIIAQIGEKTLGISNEMETAAIQIKEAKVTHRPDYHKYLRDLLSSLGEKQESYAAFLQGANDELSVALDKTNESIEYVVTYSPLATEKDKDDLNKFIASTLEMEKAAGNNKESSVKFLSVMEAMPSYEQKFSNAIQYVCQQVRRYINHNDQVISMASRIRAISENRLNK